MNATLGPSGGFPPSIPRLSRAERGSDSAGFWALRALAIERAQAASGKTWTDYNLHDPGVTTLEAFGFALTEIGYHAQLAVRDQLCGPTGEIDYTRQALFPPEEILIARASTTADYRRLALDASTDISEVRVAPPAGDGLFRLQILMAHDDPAAQRGTPRERPDRDFALHAALAACRRERTLGEDFDETVGAIAVMELDLELRARIEGGREPEDILAQIFAVCADVIAPAAPVLTLEALRAMGRSLDHIFDGPAVRHGFIQLGAQIDPPADRLRRAASARRLEAVMSALRSQILVLPGVADVESLRLRRRGSDDTVGQGAIPRLLAPRPGAYMNPEHRPGGEGHAPAGAADLSLIRLTRRGAPLRGAATPAPPADVHFDAEEVASRFEDLRAGRRRARQSARSTGERIELPSGVWRPRTPFYSIANHFPPVYGLGEAEPGGGGEAAAFRTYLAILDQALSALSSQTDHLRDLFSADGRIRQSYWPGVLDDRSVASITELYRPLQPAEVETRVFAPLDDFGDRRQRVLDYLLSLYGETYDQSRLAQFLQYLDSVETERALLTLKTHFLQQVVHLGRDRVGGLDYAGPLWNSTTHGSGFHRRLSYLVGFEDPTPRSLTAHLRSGADRTSFPLFGPEAGPEPGEVDRPPSLATVPPDAFLQWREGDGPGLTEDHARETLGDRRSLPLDLAPWAVDRRWYRWLPARNMGGELAIATDQGQSWSFGHFESLPLAARVAAWLRHRALGLARASEGLHVVEPILLRWRAQTEDVTRLAFRAILVLPNWTSRTARLDFQDFVAKTAAENAPAHVMVQCLWLGVGEMRSFETAYEAWLTALRGYCHGEASGAELDGAAAPVRDAIGLDRATT